MPVIVEHAILPVRPGQETDFESAFEQARPLISCQSGFLSLTLSRSIESPSSYLLHVEWDSIEAHTDGFRTSQRVPRLETAAAPLLRTVPDSRTLRRCPIVGSSIGKGATC